MIAHTFAFPLSLSLSLQTYEIRHWMIIFMKIAHIFFLQHIWYLTCFVSFKIYVFSLSIELIHKQQVVGISTWILLSESEYGSEGYESLISFLLFWSFVCFFLFVVATVSVFNILHFDPWIHFEIQYDI